ncbi:MAG: ATP-binding protein [Christensenellales bacterium]
MKKRKGLMGIFAFFVWTTIVIETAVLAYDAVAQRTQEKKWISLIMLAVIVLLSAICAALDAIRRRKMVDKPVEKILNATTKIAQGDFDQQIELSRWNNEFDEISDKINTMARELKQSAMLNSDFVSNVSHEMKTPLSVISAYAKWLGSSDLSPEERKQYSEKLIQAADKMADLVNNVLKLNKLEHQELEIELKKFDLTDQIAEIVAAYEPAISDKGLQLECDLQELSIISNENLLELVWNNLLSNAVKFTDKGFVKIKLGRSGDCAVVKIIDSGCGIAPENGERIFDKFYQCDKSHSAKGNGLGLAMVKQVIDLVGGKISVSSQENVGTTFTVVLKGVVNE